MHLLAAMRRTSNCGRSGKAPWAALLLAWVVGLATGVLVERIAGLPRTDTPVSVDASAASPATSAGDAAAQLSPEQVVRKQIDCLARALDPATPGALAECYTFASPANRTVIGTLEQFADLLREPPYDVLLHQSQALVGREVVRDDAATVLVTVVDDAKKLSVFRFMLSRQRRPPYAGRWMTDAVTLEAESGPTPLPPPEESLTAAR